MTRRKRKSRSRSGGHGKGFFWRNWSYQTKRRIITAFVLMFVTGIPYVIYLDYEIRTQFEGKRWAIPARVFARPLEIFPDMELNATQFEKELRLLAYRKTNSSSGQGSYIRNQNHFFVHTRAFKFWDGSEPNLRLRLDFVGERLVSLRHAESGTPLPLVRLDPGIVGRIYPSHNEDRVLVKLKEVPQLLIDALTTVEDRDFYSHYGVSLKSIARAFMANLRAGGTVQGGSTLTQQLVKNFFLTNERSLWRKANEAVMALLLEWHYSKDEILEAYINEIYLGQDGSRAIHGFGLASYFYFEQPIKNLTPAQITLLVALVKGASYYAPRRRAERAKNRRDLVLDLLYQQKIITESVANSAKSEALGVTARAKSSVSSYPAFLDLVRRQLRRDYKDEDLNSEGLQIFTTLDPLLQESTEKAFARRLERLGKEKDLPDSELQAAGTIVSVDGGEVLAMIGGRDAQFAGFNRALDAVRPIGSLIKPSVYLTALMQPEKYTLATLIDDGPLSLKLREDDIWTPQNFDHKNHGMVPLHESMSKSYNISTARLGLEVGVENVITTLKALGVRREMKPYPSLLLGSLALSPIEVAQMYHTLASGGFRTPLRAIREVLTTNGEPLQRYPLSVEKVIPDDYMYLIRNIMQEVTRSGTGRAVYQFVPKSHAVAGKTGTSNDLRDSWFAGFTGDKLGVIWIGMDNNEPAGLTGSQGSLRLWGDIFHVIKSQSIADHLPENIVIQTVDVETHLLADSGCDDTIELPFIKGSEPDSAPCAGGIVPIIEQLDVPEVIKEKVVPWFKRLFK